MANEQAVMIGVVALQFFFLQVWKSMREEQSAPQQMLSNLFLSIGLTVSLFSSYFVMDFIMSDATMVHLKEPAFALFVIVLILTMLLTVYIMVGAFWWAFKTFINFVWERAGWRAPFKEENRG